LKFFADECCDAGIVASLRKGMMSFMHWKKNQVFRTTRFYKEHMLKDEFCLLKIRILEN